MAYRHCDKDCQDSHREDRRQGVCDFGAGEALAEFRFCSYCGTYCPSPNEKAANVDGLAVWYTPEGTAVRVAGFLLRAIIGGTGAMLADFRSAETGKILERVYCAGQITDRRREMVPST